MEISKSKLKAGDLLELMRFSYCADKEQFVKAFSKLNLPIKSDQDLITLQKWNAKGYDKNGLVENTLGEKIKFDIKEFVSRIKLRHDKVLNCNIKFVD